MSIEKPEDVGGGICYGCESLDPTYEPHRTLINEMQDHMESMLDRFVEEGHLDRKEANKLLDKCYECSCRRTEDKIEEIREK